ncbi:uncharacterized protein LOC105849029 isoform X4 [Hydra vulgaris]|uniref:uncharacterized protein LOC136092877 isoform X4 n=1 Tax=Hydra vulgaris TaxID=6087 RepID=UPI0032EA6E51
MYAIVEFSNSVSEIIPVKWFCTEEEDECFWPEFLPLSKVSKLVSQIANPNPAWKKCNVRTLGKAATYERAREKLKLSENTPDLNITESENKEKATGVLKRKRLSTTQYFQFDSDSEDFSDVRHNKVSSCLTAERSIQSSQV